MELKSRCRWGWTPSKASRGESVLCLFKLLVAATIPWFVATSWQFLPLWSHCFLLFYVCDKIPSVFPLRTLVIAFKAHPNYPRSSPHLRTFITLRKTPFPFHTRYNFQVVGVRIWCIRICHHDVSLLHSACPLPLVEKSCISGSKPWQPSLSCNTLWSV